MTKRVHLWCVLIVLLCADIGYAQIRSGTIVGRVTDPQGAAVPGAEVSVRDQGTNLKNDVTTNDRGEFTVPYLPAGAYEVTVRAAGFKTFSRTSINLTTAQSIRVDAALEVGALETLVTVEASTVQLQTESSRIVNQIDEKVIQSIPNINNNPLNYATLQQGVVGRQSMSDTTGVESFGVGTGGRRAFANFSVNGAAAFANDIQLDGVSIQASAWNEVAILPNTEGIQEVKTTINNMSAEYGRSMGTVIISTKSGTNQVRGSGQYRLRNEALNANSFENNANDPFVRRQPFKVNNYSATLGGPIFIPKFYDGRNRSFFFVSYEGMTHSRALDYFQTVPTELERRGNFSQTVTDISGVFTPVRVFDPFTVNEVGPNRFRRSEFPNAIIPNARLNPISGQFGNLFPLPNLAPLDATNERNFYNRMTRTFDRDAINTRLDHRAGAHSIYGTFGTNIGSIDSPNGWGEGSRGFLQNGGFVGAVNGDRNWYTSLGDTWVMSPTLIADFRIGLTRVAAQNRAETFDDIDYAAFGIPNEWSPAIGLQGGFPEINNFGGGWSRLSQFNQTAYLAKVERQTNWHINGSISKTTGRWNHKWGAEFRNFLSNYLDARGSYWIRSGNAFTNGNIIGPQGETITSFTADFNGSGLASYLLGAGDIRAGENAVALALSAKYFAAYMQSDWRATDRLTINLGLRYDVQPGPTERFDRLTAISYRGNTFGSPGRLTTPSAEGFGRNIYSTPWFDFGPRVGAAYRLGENTVVRAGFGVTYLPSNTGYFGGPYYYGVQNFAPLVLDQISRVYGSTPQGAVIAPFNQVSEFLTPIGSDLSDPRYYGSGSNEPRFNYEDFNNGKVAQWNFFVERRLANDYLLSVGYAGTRGYRLPMGRMRANSYQFLPGSLTDEWRQQYIASNGTDPGISRVQNPFQPATGELLPFNGVFRDRTVPLRDALMPFALFRDNLVGETVGFYTYNALMVSLQRNFRGGLLFNAHYTWSRTLELWASEAQNNNYAENAGLSTGNLDYTNHGNSYFISPNDIPHRFVSTAVWNLPFGQGRKFASGSRLVNGLLGGWNLGTVVIAQSGQPRQGFTGATNSLNGLSDRVPGADIEVPQELQRWYTSPNAVDRTVTLPSGRQVIVCRFCYLQYSSDAFSGRTVTAANGNVLPDIYWFGNAANRYGDVRGWGRFNVNLSLQKEFSVNEKVRVQLSGEATNFLNNTQWRSNMNAGNGGTFTNLTPAQRARGIQPGMLQNENFGTFAMQTFDPRQVELRLRIMF
ncbi:MAG: TonB-dependent receptor [Bryobacterales bacterium]|jgi:hypothetical protein|nr:TonB-dependent receptor [Bryobacterales bacterium]